MLTKSRSSLSFVAMVAVLGSALPWRGALAEETASPPATAPATPTAEAETPPRMYIRDGQLLTHPMTVFVTQQIEPGMNPKLRFVAAHWLTKEGLLEKVPPRLLLVAPNQVHTITVAGSEIQANGTLLVFTIEQHDVAFYKSAVRLLPSLEWTVPAVAPGKPAIVRQVVSEEDIYVGNWPGAILWTAVVVSLVLIALVVWSNKKKTQITHYTPRPMLLLITGPDGYLSLWRTQLLLWTIAVGSLVFLFGLMQLHVPEIPEPLVALMGMSLLTGLVAKAAPSQNPAPPAPAPPPIASGGRVRAHFGDLISTWNGEKQRLEFSLPKAQMVIWTVLVLVLFCIKSVLGGTLWSVPWQMVALTGFSQSGYIGDKFIKSSQ